jgi:hypothetical protein
MPFIKQIGLVFDDKETRETGMGAVSPLFLSP